MSPSGNNNITVTISVNAATGALTIQNFAQALQQLGVQLNNQGQAAGNAAGQNQKHADSVKDLAAGVYLAEKATAAYMEIMKQTIVESTLLAARVEVLNTALSVTSRNMGVSSQQAQGQVSAIRDLGITQREAIRTTLQFERAQLDLVKAQDLSRAAQNLAVVAGMNSSEATQILTEAILAQNVLMLRQFGIVRNSEQIFQSYAQQQGRTANSLSETERKAAFLSAILSEGSKVAGAYEASMEDAGKKLKTLDRIIEDAQVAIGKNFVPLLNEIVDLITELTTAASKLNPGLVKLIAGFTAGIGAAITAAIAFTTIVKGWQILFAALGAELAVATAGVSVFVGLLATAITSYTLFNAEKQNAAKIAEGVALEEQGQIERLKLLDISYKSLVKEEQKLADIRSGRIKAEGSGSVTAAQASAQMEIKQLQEVEKLRKKVRSEVVKLAPEALINKDDGSFQIDQQLEKNRLIEHEKEETRSLNQMRDELSSKEQKLLELRKEQMSLEARKSDIAYRAAASARSSVPVAVDLRQRLTEVNQEWHKMQGEVVSLQRKLDDLTKAAEKIKLPEFNFKASVEELKSLQNDLRTLKDLKIFGGDTTGVNEEARRRVQNLSTMVAQARTAAEETARINQPQGKVFKNMAEVQAMRAQANRATDNAQILKDFEDQLDAIARKKSLSSVDADRATQIAAQMTQGRALDALNESSKIQGNASEASAEYAKTRLQATKDQVAVAVHAYQQEINLVQAEKAVNQAREQSYVTSKLDLQTQHELNLMAIERNLIAHDITGTQAKLLTQLEDERAFLAGLKHDQEAINQSEEHRLQIGKELLDFNAASASERIAFMEKEFNFRETRYYLLHRGEVTMESDLAAMRMSHISQVAEVRRKDAQQSLQEFAALIDSQTAIVEANRSTRGYTTAEDIDRLEALYKQKNDLELKSWMASDEARNLDKNKHEVYLNTLFLKGAELDSQLAAKKRSEMDAYWRDELSFTQEYYSFKAAVAQANNEISEVELSRIEQIHQLDQKILRLRQDHIAVSVEQEESLKRQINYNAELARLSSSTSAAGGAIEASQSGVGRGAALDKASKSKLRDQLKLDLQDSLAMARAAAEELQAAQPGTEAATSAMDRYTKAMERAARAQQALAKTSRTAATAMEIGQMASQGFANAVGNLVEALIAGEPVSFKEMVAEVLKSIAVQSAVQGALCLAYAALSTTAIGAATLGGTPPQFLAAAALFFAAAAATGGASAALGGGKGGGGGGGGGSEAQKFEPTKTSTDIRKGQVEMEDDLTVRGRQLLMAGQDQKLLAGILSTLQDRKGPLGIEDWRTLTEPLSDSLAQRLAVLSIRQSASNESVQSVLTNMLAELRKANEKDMTINVPVEIGIDGGDLGNMMDGRIKKNLHQFNRETTKGVVRSLRDNSGRKEMHAALTDGGV